MAKIERESITRGTRLPVQAVFPVLDDVATAIGTVSVEKENLADPYSPVRVHFQFPVVGSRFFRGTFVGGVGPIDFAFPFSFPPLQEYFSNTLIPNETTPELILDEFQLSFDQRGEPCVIGSGLTAPGEMNFDSLALQDMTVALMEKPQVYRAGAAPATEPYIPETEIFSLEIPSIDFSDRNLRSNPFIIDGLNKTLNPYRTYMFMLNASLNDATHLIDIISLNISFRLRHPLVPRDLRTAGVRNIQNIPTHNGAKNPDAIAISTPVADSLILADAGTGIHANAKLIDQRLAEGLRGGYWRSGHTPVTEHIADDAGYGVMVVPMWHNTGGGGLGVNSGSPQDFVSAAPAPYAGWAVARRVIPLNWPITIHHVVAMVSYAWPDDGAGDVGEFPTSATFQTAIGVGVGTGDRADRVAFQTVAFAEWNNATKNNYLIDRIKHKRDGALTSEAWDFELMGLPIVGYVPGADAGSGYFDQGQPVYAGRSTSSTQARSNVGGGTPNTEGAEQFLEIRWHMRDINGLAYILAPTPGAALSVRETYVGMTGHFVYIYYKNHIAGGARDFPL